MRGVKIFSPIEPLDTKWSLKWFMLQNKTKTGWAYLLMGLSQAHKEAHKRTKEGRDIKPTQNLYIKIKSLEPIPFVPFLKFPESKSRVEFW